MRIGGKQMTVVVAIDSLKGCLTSTEAGTAIETGIKRVFPEAKVFVRPLADGGEGTVEALVAGLKKEERTTELGIKVTGPLGAKVLCTYGILHERKTAIIEMAAAAGITLVPKAERNPLKATTYGVGEVIKDAIHRGCRNFIIGIGGSATNDGGAGMLMALGYDFLDQAGKPIPLGAEGLKDLASIDDKNVLPALKGCKFQIASDVSNPLYGENGASRVFGPQKGATEQMVQDMDSWLEHYANIAQAKYAKANPSLPGTGAAGGLGFAFLGFTNAELESGIKLILEETKLEAYIKDADVVVTGEGRLDFQTAMGKAPIGVAQIAKKHGKKVLAFSGSVDQTARANNERGIDAFFPIIPEIMTLEEAMDAETATRNMTNTVEQVFRVIKMMS
jgi:glycerate kinase